MTPKVINVISMERGARYTYPAKHLEALDVNEDDGLPYIQVKFSKIDCSGYFA
jgi:hypothetical protein